MFVTLFPQYFSALTHATFPPFPADFPPNFGTFGFHSRKPFPRIQAESKPIHPKEKHKRSLT
jgi:hypothetical protein